MRTVILLVLVFISAVSVSQTASSDIKVRLDFDPLFEKMNLMLESDSDTLDPYEVRLIDSKKNIIKTIELSNATKQIRTSISVQGLVPGDYVCLIFKKGKEVYKQEFFKDAFLGEPQVEPTLYRSPE